ncbi:hypothetical protein HIM_11084 [Hirsutella minnesotensis 3608]|uniref:Myb-like domain-containing protein n=1 Tax=Hirsutella minnesotensis 3608 TaxID=1043627 RepID=A0A0F7ZWT3_9HYPO|nr:hypothetical protein HIM_11084 [Hirsutella minnesotensis 3608]
MEVGQKPTPTSTRSRSSNSADPATVASSTASLRDSKNGNKSSGGNSDSRTSRHAQSKPDITLTAKPFRYAADSSSQVHLATSRRCRVKSNASSILPPWNPPSTTTELCRSTTPTSPAWNGKGETAYQVKLQHATRHPGDTHLLESTSLSLAALLAVTNIPLQIWRRRRRRTNKPLSVDTEQRVSKELSLRMELLLSPPGNLQDGDHVDLSVRSADSVRSLVGDFFFSDTISSVKTPVSLISSLLPKRQLSPVRKSLEPVSSPSDATDDHPLAGSENVTGLQDEGLGAFEQKSRPAESIKPLRSVIKSNPVSSLRALRSATTSVPSINFLTRSVVIDPNVPYTDECRPPVMEEMPLTELRRYLNPTTSTHSSRHFSASIQMQTYKTKRSWDVASDSLSVKLGTRRRLAKRRRWSALEERRLTAWKRESKSESWIASKLNRTESAVKQQWRKMSDK